MIGWLVEALLRMAVRRWPEEARDAREREWRGELHAQSRRQQLAFVASLASSSPTQGWREQLGGAGRWLQPVLALVAVGVGCVVAAEVPVDVAGVARTGLDWSAHLVSAGGMGVAAVLAALTGRLLGRRAPVGAGPVGSVVVGAIALGLGISTMHTLELSSADEGPGVRTGSAIALGVWLVLAVPVAGLVVRLDRRGHRGPAITIAVVGGLAVLDLVAVAAVAWFDAASVERWAAPLWLLVALTYPMAGSLSLGDISIGSEFMPLAAAEVRPLVLATAVLLAYGMATGRSTRGVPVAPTAASLPRGVRAAGALLVAGGVGIWAYAAPVLTEGLVNQTAEDAEYLIWAQEIRLAAILGILAGLVLWLAGRGAIIVPVVVGGAVLVTLDTVSDRYDLAGPGVALRGVAVGLAVALACAGLGRLLARGADELATRRALVAVAVICASCAPILLFHIPGMSVSRLPVGFAWATAAIQALLGLAAVVAALAARPTRPSRALAASLLVGAPLVLGGLGSLSLGGTYLPGLAAFAAPLLAVLILLVARPRSWRVTLGLVLLGVVGVIPAFYAELKLAIIVGSPLLAAAGLDRPSEGLPLLPGAILVALASAVGLAAWTVPRATKSQPVPAETGLPRRRRVIAAATGAVAITLVLGLLLPWLRPGEARHELWRLDLPAVTGYPFAFSRVPPRFEPPETIVEEGRRLVVYGTQFDGMGITVSSAPVPRDWEPTETSAVTVAGHPATLWTAPKRLTPDPNGMTGGPLIELAWQQDGLWVRVVSLLGSVDVEEVRRVAESIVPAGPGATGANIASIDLPVGYELGRWVPDSVCVGPREAEYRDWGWLGVCVNVYRGSDPPVPTAMPELTIDGAPAYVDGYGLVVRRPDGRTVYLSRSADIEVSDDDLIAMYRGIVFR